MIRRTYSFKLYQSKRLRFLDDTRYVSSQVFNHCIALHKRYFRLYKKHLPKARLQAHLSKIKHRFRPDWKKINAQSMQNITDRIETGYQLFFEERKKGNKRIKPPTFRKVRNYKSFTLKQDGWKVQGNTLTIQKRPYKFFKSRDIQGSIKTVTLKKDKVGDWWVFFSTISEVQTQAYAPTGKTVGIDFSLKTFLTLSDGKTIASPQFFKQNQRAIAKASRNLSRKKKGSNNRRKARIALSRLHRKVERKRTQFHWITVLSLARQYDVVCIEDLNLTGMKALWGRKVSDLGFGEFIHIADHVLRKHGRTLVRIDRWYLSSKTCSVCGQVNNDLTLGESQWDCGGCGTHHQRDYNASVNIEHEGVRIWTLAGESVRPLEKAA